MSLSGLNAVILLHSLLFHLGFCTVNSEAFRSGVFCICSMMLFCVFPKCWLYSVMPADLFDYNLSICQHRIELLRAQKKERRQTTLTPTTEGKIMFAIVWCQRKLFELLFWFRPAVTSKLWWLLVVPTVDPQPLLWIAKIGLNPQLTQHFWVQFLCFLKKIKYFFKKLKCVFLSFTCPLTFFAS